ncbi:hypothetical protein SEA_CLOWN_43 [Gordonia phage Clown]|uniref:Uncharacterized protein n=1 Tax=Gordonia phage Clown TaxID=2759393 RepID=A0A7L7SIG6_9CAUD|nr:hypothetical protein KNV25_gp43 [Gordonia phage Clown]QOC56041.1 hypothetical protein SEA_CLOWN_43 [Gordonia phage Clown]
MSRRIRIFVPPYDPDCAVCRRLVDTESPRPDWRDWFTGPGESPSRAEHE